MIRADLQLARADFSLMANFAVAGGVTGIFGPSGSGKTTLLRMLAGLETEAYGALTVRDEQWQGGATFLNASQRRAGFVFQDSALFPHLSVGNNLEYARKRVRKDAFLIDLEELIDSLGIRALLHRNPRSLSGGERQRVAIGRALAAAPSLLLLDEPLSALDQESRDNLVQTLEKVFQSIDIPVFYVSHSSDEIARLADNLILLESGKVTAYGETNQVLGAIDAPFNASDEAFSILRGKVVSATLPYLTTVRTAGGSELHITSQELEPDSQIRLRLRARDVSVCLSRPEGSSILNILPATVMGLADAPIRGSRTIKLDINGEVVLARLSEYSVQTLALTEGKHVFAQIKSVSLLS